MSRSLGYRMRRVLLVFTLLIVAGLASACGSAEPSEETSAQDAAPSAETMMPGSNDPGDQEASMPVAPGADESGNIDAETGTSDANSEMAPEMEG